MGAVSEVVNCVKRGLLAWEVDDGLGTGLVADYVAERVVE